MTKKWEIRGQNDTNAQIITTDNGRIYKPGNLLNAISEIQQFYVYWGQVLKNHFCA